MELSSSNIKKILIFPEMKPCIFRPEPSKFFPKKPALKKFLILSQRKAFLIFPEMEPCTFHPKLEKQKKSTQEKFLMLHETETPKKFLVFSQKKAFLILPEKETPKRKL